MITNDLLLLKDHLTNILSGFTKTGTGQLQNLLTEFIESMSHISKEPEKKNLYIEICAQMNKISLLETKRYSALRNLKTAQHLYSDLVSKDPQNVTYLQEYCDFLIWENKFEEALEILSRIIIRKLIPLQRNRALHSLYEVNILMGRFSEAKRWLSLMPNIPSVNYSKSMTYIQNENIIQGLVEYKKNLDNIPVRFSNIPKWNGVHLGYRAAVFTLTDHRGGGDEVAFSRCLKGINNIPNLYIESEPRCKELYKSSFPNANIFNYAEQAPWVKSELYIKPKVQISTRSLFVKNVLEDPVSLESCENLRCDHEMVETFRSKTDDFAQGKFKLGLSWRTYHVLGPAARESMKIKELEKFKLLEEEVAFFNFQYDLTSEDILFFNEIAEINIYDPGFDQLNDFQQVGAYALSLDLIFTVMNTNSAIANSVGAQVIEARPEFMSSCLLVLPMFQKRTTLLRSWDEPWESTVQKAIQLIKKEVKQKRSN